MNGCKIDCGLVVYIELVEIIGRNGSKIDELQSKTKKNFDFEDLKDNFFGIFRDLKINFLEIKEVFSKKSCSAFFNL